MIGIRSKLHEIRQLIAFKLMKNSSSFTTSDGSSDADEMLHSRLQIHYLYRKIGKKPTDKTPKNRFPKDPE